MKDMTNMVQDDPDVIDPTLQTGANAKVMTAAAQAAAAQTPGSLAAPANIGPTTTTTRGGDFEPIANVSLELYAEISRSLASVNYDQSTATELAAVKGVSNNDWAAALTGWNARLQSNPAVANQFSALCTDR